MNEPDELGGFGLICTFCRSRIDDQDFLLSSMSWLKGGSILDGSALGPVTLIIRNKVKKSKCQNVNQQEEYTKNKKTRGFGAGVPFTRRRATS